MIFKYLSNKVKSALQTTLTSEQNILIEKLSRFVLGDISARIFVVKGFAGTGKTFVISAFLNILNEFKISSVLLAPTGRAAKVIGQNAAHPAFTIHKFIYRQQTTKDGLGRFVLDRNTRVNTIFWIDEASMIADRAAGDSIFGTGKLLDDLFYFVSTGKNCKLVLIGDTAQLPPVGLEVSAALDTAYLKNHFRIGVSEFTLYEVVRQSRKSGIYHNATLLRKQLSSGDPPKLKIQNFADVERISGRDLIDYISDSYHQYGQNNTIVITTSNKRATLINQAIRHQIFGYEERLENSDFLMIVKNNYFYLQEENDFISNGEIVELVRIYSTEEMYDFEYADVLLKFPEKDHYELKAKIMLNVLENNSPALNQLQTQKLFTNLMQDYEGVKTKREKVKLLKNNKYFNALQIKYAYAVTCHKAQGGQWDAVFIDQGYLPNTGDTAYIRWLYTAMTRGVKKLYLINFRDEMFIN